MNKRDFLKASGAMLTSGLFANLLAAEHDSATRTNWAGNYQYRAAHLYEPASVAELQSTIKDCKELRALGTRHAFNGIADSTADQISVKHLDGIALDRAARTVTVGSGVRYGSLAPDLYRDGFALANLASLPHISVAGACATGTHGSGMKIGNLSTAVSAIEFVTANGEIATLSRKQNPDTFPGAVVGLGALGVLTKLTLDVLPGFDVQQVVYQNLPIAQLETHLDDIFATAYSVSLFTDWQGGRVSQVWVKRRVEHGKQYQFPPELFTATLAKEKLHPLAGHSPENCTEQMGIPGPWYERLPHFKMNFTPSSGQELQSEFFVPRNRGYEALRAVESLRDSITPHLMISELRTIAADDLWMSPAYQRESLAIHFTWQPDWPAVRKVLPLIEAKLEPFEARPHWAKLFTMAPERLQSRYAKLPDFRRLINHYDSEGKFRNEFIHHNLFSA